MGQCLGMDQENVDLMFQVYFGDQDQNMFFDSFGLNIGNMNFDFLVGVNFNVINDQGGLDEIKIVVQFLGQF